MINATELYFDNIDLVKIFTVDYSNSTQITLNLLAKSLPEANIQQYVPYKNRSQNSCKPMIVNLPHVSSQMFGRSQLSLYLVTLEIDNK